VFLDSLADAKRDAGLKREEKQGLSRLLLRIET
jgi:hypothetical protein